MVVNATPPQTVDDTPVVGSSAAFSSDPAIACSPSLCLTVWVDSRLPGAIFGTVLAPDGTPLTPTGVQITNSLSTTLHPAVAFDGASFVVAWATSSGPVMGVRVNTLGVVLDPSPIPLTISSTASRPTMASAGGVTLLSWQDHRSAPRIDVYARRLGPTLNALDGADVPISVVGGDSRAPSVGTDGSDFLVSYTALDAPSLRPMSAGGLVGPVTALAASGFEPTVSFGAGVYLVCWSTGVEVIGARVDPLGSLLGGRFSISGVGGGTQRSPGSGFSNGEFLVAWVVEIGPQPWDVMAHRVAPDGTLLEPAKFALGSTSGFDDHPSVASLDLTFFTVWTATGAPGFSTVAALGARLPSIFLGGTPVPFPLALSANSQESASIATNGAQSLAVWVDRRGSSSHLYAMPLSALGQPQLDAGVPLCTNAANQVSPRVAFDGTNYFAVWSDWRAGSNSGIYGARISATGTVLDPNGASLTIQASLRTSPAVAPIDAGFLVVWGDGRNATFDVYATRVSPSGAVLDGTGFAIASSTSDSESAPRLSSLGPLALVAWQTSPASSRVFAARVASDGTVLDPDGIGMPLLGGKQASPTVANDGARFLVVWLETQPDGGIDVAGARVAADGTVLDPAGLSISTTAGRRTWPEATFDGARYVVSWQTADRGREGVLVSPLGVVIGAEFSIAPDALKDSAGQASTSTPGVTAVAYSAFDARTGYVVSRLRSKFIEVLDASVDAGNDAGSASDAGQSADGGRTVDAGAPAADAGSDAGIDPDAGNGADAGLRDAGEAPDAGSEVRGLQVRCGCELSAGSGGGLLAILWLSALRMRPWRGHRRPARCRRSCPSDAPR